MAITEPQTMNAESGQRVRYPSDALSYRSLRQGPEKGRGTR